MASGEAHDDHAPVPVAEDDVDLEASGVLTVDVDHADQLPSVDDDALTGLELVLELTDCQSAQVEAPSAGLVEVELLEHEVEVLVQTGTEIVHGQSVTVRVVLAVMV